MQIKDVQIEALVSELRSLIEGARSMPMSASAVVNRTQALDVVTRIEAAMSTARDAENDHADDQTRDGADAGQASPGHEAEQVLQDAERERDRLVSETEVLRVARVEAERVRAAAQHDAEELRKETDDYVDARLATFEVSLTKILAAVTRGRARLQGRSHFEELGEASQGLGEPDADGSEAAHGTRPGGESTRDDQVLDGHARF